MKTLIITAFTALSLGVYAQNLENENFIVEYLGQSRFDDLQTNNPAYLAFLDVKCSDGYKVVDMTPEKSQGMAVLQEIKVHDSNNKITKTPTTITPDAFVALFEEGQLNILLYALPGHQTEMTYYALGSTGKVLMLYPVEYISKKTNNK